MPFLFVFFPSFIIAEGKTVAKSRMRFRTIGFLTETSFKETTCQEEVCVGLLRVSAADVDPVSLRGLVGHDGGARPHHEGGGRGRRRDPSVVVLARGRQAAMEVS